VRLQASQARMPHEAGQWHVPGSSACGTALTARPWAPPLGPDARSSSPGRQDQGVGTDSGRAPDVRREAPLTPSAQARGTRSGPPNR
jgi:hypothetical protein